MHTHTHTHTHTHFQRAVAEQLSGEWTTSLLLECDGWVGCLRYGLMGKMSSGPQWVPSSLQFDGKICFSVSFLNEDIPPKKATTRAVKLGSGPEVTPPQCWCCMREMGLLWEHVSMCSGRVASYLGFRSVSHFLPRTRTHTNKHTKTGCWVNNPIGWTSVVSDRWQ